MSFITRSPWDQASDNAHADRAHKLYRVEAQNSADLRRIHGECGGELAAGATHDALDRVEWITKGDVRGHQRRVYHAHKGQRDEPRCVGNRTGLSSAAHRPEPPSEVERRHRSSSVVRRRLPLDWAERYNNTTAVLIETFVETPRYIGAVYKVSGWIHVEIA